jgi:hypothetical protein
VRFAELRSGGKYEHLNRTAAIGGIDIRGADEATGGFDRFAVVGEETKRTQFAASLTTMAARWLSMLMSLA